MDGRMMRRDAKRCSCYCEYLMFEFEGNRTWGGLKNNSETESKNR
jgi:hypothetical protein